MPTEATTKRGLMGKFFARVRSQIRERENAQAIHAIPIDDRPLIVYAEDDYSWNQLGPYLEVILSNATTPVVYITSDPDDPRLSDNGRMAVYYLRDYLPTFLPRIDSPVFLTTMPDLDAFHLKRPASSTCVYAFHSLNSTHMAYRSGAFDAYDVFFCTGPHHTRELRMHFDRLGRSDVQLRDIGYPKLDRIQSAWTTYTKLYPSDTTVLVAPSWGTHNLLAANGEAIIETLSGAGYRTIVRPHPAFFESIYPEGTAIVGNLRNRFAASENVIFETSITSENSFMEADLMVSDWSGAAFEYALGTERPALFMDLPPKIMNPDWAQLGITPFEDRMRREVGEVAPPDDMQAVKRAADRLRGDRERYRSELQALRSQCVYNSGSSAEAGAAALDELVNKSAS